MRTDLGNRQCSGNLAGVKGHNCISTVTLLDICSHIRLNTDLTMYCAQSRCSTNMLAIHTSSYMSLVLEHSVRTAVFSHRVAGESIWGLT